MQQQALGGVGEWASLEIGDKTTGSSRCTCPVCSESRSKKKEKVVRVDHDKGVAYCHHCESVFFRDPAALVGDDFDLPEQTWKNYTELSDPIVKWLEEERKIPQFVAKQLGWTEEKKWIPEKQKELSTLCFNYFEAGLVVNKKYRTGKTKHFAQAKGGKQILYNVQDAIGAKELWIVEGELDVASLRLMGVKVVSVPNASDHDKVWIHSKKYLQGVERFIIATDNDEKGNAVAEKISHRLGRWRCKRVLFENKDANGDLVAGILKESMKNQIPYPVSGVLTPKKVLAKSYELYDKGVPETLRPKSPCFNDFNKVFSTMRGHLVVVTGIPSNGKSSFLEWYALNLVNDYKMKASFYSPEHHPMELFQNQLAEKYWGKSTKKHCHGERMTKEELKEFADWAEGKVYYLTNEDGSSPTWKWIISKMKEQVFVYGIDMFIIDNFAKLILPGKNSEVQEIKNLLAELTAFCQAHNVLLFLVAHPTKMKKNDEGEWIIPDLYDVAGAAHFRNQTHDGLVVHRSYNPDRTIVMNLKTKYQFQGEHYGQAEFEYCLASARFYPLNEGYQPHKIGDRPTTKGSEFVATDYSAPQLEQHQPQKLDEDWFKG